MATVYWKAIYVRTLEEAGAVDEALRVLRESLIEAGHANLDFDQDWEEDSVDEEEA